MERILPGENIITPYEFRQMNDREAYSYLKTVFPLYQQDVDEITWVLERIREHCGMCRVVVEIGSLYGANLCMLSRVCEDTIISIDPEIINHPANGPIMKGAVRRLVEPVEFVHIKARSEEDQTVEKLKDVISGLKVDVLFDDGDHHYDIVKANFLSYSPLVSSMYVFHDLMDVHQGPPRVFDEMKKHYHHESKVMSPKIMGTGILFPEVHDNEKVVYSNSCFDTCCCWM